MKSRLESKMNNKTATMIFNDHQIQSRTIDLFRQLKSEKDRSQFFNI